MEYLLCDVEGAVVGANVFVNRDLGVEFFGKQIVAEVAEPVVPQASRELKDRRNRRCRACWTSRKMVMRDAARGSSRIKRPIFCFLGGEVGA